MGVIGAMSSFFDRMFGWGKAQDGRTANKAKERLQFILVHDRINLPPERLNEMKAKILAVISEFVNVSVDEVDIDLRQNDRNSNIIVAEIPFSHSLDTDDAIDENADMLDDILADEGD
jgi:cell division topological specificity factor